MSLFRGENPNLGIYSAFGEVTNLQLLSASGAISPSQSATYEITLGSAAALTLAAPSQDGLNIIVISSTAFAHTITATGLFQTGAATVNVATFPADAGATLSLMSFKGKWQVVSLNAVVMS